MWLWRQGKLRKLSRGKQVKESMFDYSEDGGFYGLMAYAGTFHVNLMFQWFVAMENLRIVSNTL